MTPFPPDSSEKSRIRLLLVEDHLITRLGLRTLLAGYSQLDVAGEADSVESALAEAARLRPDVVLMDVRLSDGTGFEACRQLQKSGNSARVLILTSYTDDETLFQCLAAGADGYLLKDIDAAGLLRAIEAVAAGKSILDPAVTHKVLSRLRAGETDAARTCSGNLEALSPQERRILGLVAEGKTNKQIAAELSLSPRTVKNYLSNALDKLQVSRRSRAAALFVEHFGPSRPAARP